MDISLQKELNHEQNYRENDTETYANIIASKNKTPQQKIYIIDANNKEHVKNIEKINISTIYKEFGQNNERSL